MVFRPARLILIFSLMVMSNLLFTNCEYHPSSDRTAEPSVTSGAAYNGGGHSGKISYLFTHAEEDPCLYPNLSLDIENGSTRAFTLGCSGATETQFAPADLKTFDHDPYFLIYKGKIFAHDSLLQVGKNERSEFQVFCTNATYENRGLDFAVKYTRVYSSQPYTLTEGFLLRGNEGREPSVTSEAGRYRDPDAQGIRVFQSSSGAFDVVVTPVSSTQAEGVLRLRPSGTQIPMDCVLKAPLRGDAG